MQAWILHRRFAHEDYPIGDCPNGGNHEYKAVGGDGANCVHGNITAYCCQKCGGTYTVDDNQISPDGHADGGPCEGSFDCETGGHYIQYCANGCGTTVAEGVIEGGGSHSWAVYGSDGQGNTLYKCTGHGYGNIHCTAMTSAPHGQDPET